MRFITGLKNLSKKKLLLIIVILFITLWFLFILVLITPLSNIFIITVIFSLGFLGAFLFTLFIFSLFIPIEKMGIALIIIIAIVTIFIIYFFSGIIHLFYVFSFVANYILMALFAFRFSMDTSLAIDDYLYKKKSSRVITRILEFVIFLLISVWFGLLLIQFFRNSSIPAFQSAGNLLIIIALIDLILLVFVLLRLIFTKKLAAYIPLFIILTFICMLYFIVDLFYAYLFADPSSYIILSFIIDLLLFLYIIGSILGRVEYLQDKIKILKADTISVFVILMKILVQLIKGLINIGAIPLGNLILTFLIIFWFFVIFTLVIGVYTIFAHKEGKSS